MDLFTGQTNDYTKDKNLRNESCDFRKMFQGFIDKSLDMHIIINPFYNDQGEIIDFTCIYKNASSEKIWRLPKGITGRLISEFFPNFPQSYAFSMFKGVVESGEPIEFEEYYRLDGQDAWYHIFATQVSTGVAVSAQDINDRKNAEKIIRQSQEQHSFLLKLGDILQPLLDSVEIHSAVTSTAMEHFKADRCFYCEIDNNYAIIRQDSYRCNLHSIVGVYPLNDLPIYTRMMKNGEPFVSSNIKTTNQVDGALRQLCIQLKIISYINIPVIKGGKPVGLLCVAQSTTRTWTEIEIQLAIDIAQRTWISTERGKTERALQKSERKYRKLFETSSDGFAWIDKYGYITESTAETAFMGGYSLDEVIGKSIMDFVSDEWKENAHKKLIKLKSMVANRYEAKLKKKDGSLIWVKISSAPEINDEGEFTGALLTFKDITKNKVSQERLRRSEKVALDLVSELEDEDKKKNEFISILSHELRNPLASIVSGTQLLEFSNKDGKSLRTIKSLKRQTEHLSKLVEDLLDITRISRKTIIIRKEIAELNIIVRDIIEDSRVCFEEKNIHLSEDICPQPILVNADPLRITQCVGNILLNALKFTHENGSVNVSLGINGKMAEIIIKDNGMGICPEMMPSIFEPFKKDFRTYDDYNNMGLGLGLHIVKENIEKHGGYVTASSLGLKKGTIFTMGLPIFQG